MVLGENIHIQNFEKTVDIGIENWKTQNPNSILTQYLENIYKTLPKGKKLILPYNCSIKFGQPIKFNSLEMEDILKTAEKEILKIKES